MLDLPSPVSMCLHVDSQPPPGEPQTPCPFALCLGFLICQLGTHGHEMSSHKPAMCPEQLDLPDLRKPGMEAQSHLSCLRRSPASGGSGASAGSGHPAPHTPGHRNRRGMKSTSARGALDHRGDSSAVAKAGRVSPRGGNTERVAPAGSTHSQRTADMGAGTAKPPRGAQRSGLCP